MTTAPAAFLADVLPDDQYSTAANDRDDHSRDWATTPEEAIEPDVVVWPESTDDVSAVLAAAEAACGAASSRAAVAEAGGAT